MASASGYNHHRFARALLKKSRKWEASLTVELLPTHWRFADSPVNFQYNGPMTPFLIALRSQVIPASLIPFLYDIKPPISFVDGCLVVEIHDLRKTPEVKSRVVMRPAAEALAQTIDVMLETRGWPKGDGTLALELESNIIAATSPPLYLGTSILAARNAALAIQLTTPAQPNVSAKGSFRNPSSSVSGDDKSTESETIRKMMHAGERTSGGTFQPRWSVLRAKEELEKKRANAAAEAAQAALVSAQQAAAQAGMRMEMMNGQASASGATGTTGGAGGGGGAASGAGESKPKKPKKKRAAPKDESTGAGAGAGTGAGTGGASGGATDGPSKPKKKKVDPEKKKVAAGGAGNNKKKAAGGGGGGTGNPPGAKTGGA